MTDLNYSPLQERAIDAIVAWYGDKQKMEFYLAGYAGTGKSTVVAEAINRVKEKYGIKEVPTGAYTGKAAYVLRKKGNPNALTIHSMIYTKHEDPETGDLHFVLNLLGKAAMADLIVLDECSMIDIVMANDLRSFGKKILVMGDPGQLPPINGQGSFTAQMPDFFLDEIHRQAADSPIIELATMARNGIMPPNGYSKAGVQVMRLTGVTGEHIHNPNTQVLCGVNRIRWGATAAMRKKLGFLTSYPEPDERVLCCKNNRNHGLFNGGAGTIKKLEIRDAHLQWHEVKPGKGIPSQTLFDPQNMPWRFAGEIEGNYLKNIVFDPFLFYQHNDGGASKRNIKKKWLNEFDFGYVWTVHKAQGSQWEHVTLVDNSGSFREHRWNHLYTGITRAEKDLIILTEA